MQKRFYSAIAMVISVAAASAQTARRPGSDLRASVVGHESLKGLKKVDVYLSWAYLPPDTPKEPIPPVKVLAPKLTERIATQLQAAGLEVGTPASPNPSSPQKPDTGLLTFDIHTYPVPGILSTSSLDEFICYVDINLKQSVSLQRDSKIVVNAATLSLPTGETVVKLAAMERTLTQMIDKNIETFVAQYRSENK
jgi:hypothetical protein